MMNYVPSYYLSYQLNNSKSTKSSPSIQEADSPIPILSRELEMERKITVTYYVVPLDEKDVQLEAHRF
jgi:hypothetical protein